MKNILITGSNGFIGKHVCEYLKKQGHYIIGLGRRKNTLSQVDDYVCCDMDTDKVNDIYDMMQTNDIDAVVHLAADMRKEPYGIEIVSHNCVGTQRILELCEKKKINVFVQLSSLPVIGKPMELPITEQHPLMPPTIYHATKIMEELLANYADYKHGLRTVSFRISAPVGLGMNPATIFPTFVSKAVNGEDLLLSGNGNRKQTYVHVQDIAQAISLALQNENGHGVYNLSSHNYLSNKELAERCIDVLHSNSKIVFSRQKDNMDDYDWDISIEKIQKELRYEPQIKIDQAIQEYASNFCLLMENKR